MSLYNHWSHLAISIWDKIGMESKLSTTKWRVYIYIYISFLNWGYPKWMVYKENPTKIDDLGVLPFQETSTIYIYLFICLNWLCPNSHINWSPTSTHCHIWHYHTESHQHGQYLWYPAKFMLSSSLISVKKKINYYKNSKLPIYKK